MLPGLDVRPVVRDLNANPNVTTKGGEHSGEVKGPSPTDKVHHETDATDVDFDQGAREPRPRPYISIKKLPLCFLEFYKVRHVKAPGLVASPTGHSPKSSIENHIPS